MQPPESRRWLKSGSATISCNADNTKLMKVTLRHSRRHLGAACLIAIHTALATMPVHGADNQHPATDVRTDLERLLDSRSLQEWLEAAETELNDNRYDTDKPRSLEADAKHLLTDVWTSAGYCLPSAWSR